MCIKTLVFRVIISIFVIISLSQQRLTAETATAYATITVIIPERPLTKTAQENDTKTENEYYKEEERIRVAKIESEREYNSKGELEKIEEEVKDEK